MNQPDNQHKPLKKKIRGLGLSQQMLLILLVLFLAIPLFIIIYNHIPPFFFPGTEQRMDHIVTFILVFLSVYYLARKIRHILYLSFATGVFTMIVLSLMGKYSFQELYHDYSSFLFNLREGPIRFKFDPPATGEDRLFPHASKFREAINYKEESVRNFAAQIAVINFEEYTTNSNRRIIQFFSIFKEVRKRWRYVYDPASGDYFASASETVRQLKADGKFKGDCDDYSILMAACIKAVGGKVKLVRTLVYTSSGTIGHVYPEVLVGNAKDMENVSYLIRQILFPREAKGKQIYYHVDEDNRVWLNFDYNDYYPGGKYQSNIRKAELEI